MRTPAGKECSLYYADFHRGRAVQECRLPLDGSRWDASLCMGCPVPGIQLANGCPDMALRGTATRAGWLWLSRRVSVSAYCHRAERAVDEPHIGCGLCHPAFPAVAEPPADES